MLLHWMQTRLRTLLTTEPDEPTGFIPGRCWLMVRLVGSSDAMDGL